MCDVCELRKNYYLIILTPTNFVLRQYLEISNKAKRCQNSLLLVRIEMRKQNKTMLCCYIDFLLEIIFSTNCFPAKWIRRNDSEKWIVLNEIYRIFKLCEINVKWILRNKILRNKILPSGHNNICVANKIHILLFRYKVWLIC